MRDPAEGPESVPAATPARPGALGLFSGLRPVTLGVWVLAQALAIAWIAYGHTRAPLPQPGDHTWWHSSGPVAAEGVRLGLFTALVTAAFYLLLPLSALAARALRRRARRGGAVSPYLLLAAVSAALSAAVCLPVVALASALSGNASVWSAGVADIPTVLRLCAAAGLLVAVALGVPWTATGPRRTIHSTIGF
ncbi:hypothetical protein [Streptomyces cyaneofuscatus]|uniref:hypothetical protein n=1 Tax=Streptomyces cyaneofuscatus TaxID=66883 RepID=UPI0033A5C64C